MSPESQLVFIVPYRGAHRALMIDTLSPSSFPCIHRHRPLALVVGNPIQNLCSRTVTDWATKWTVAFALRPASRDTLTGGV